MPVLDHSFPTVRVLEQDLSRLLQTEIENKNWKNAEIKSQELVFYPFYFIEFQAFREQSVAGKGNIVTKSKRSFTAMNARSLELEPAHAGDFASDLINEFSENLQPRVLSFPHELPEVKSVAVVKLSEHLQVPKENILILKIQFVYLPIWLVQAVVSNHPVDLEINAVSRAVLNSDDIPLREKGWLELTAEVLEELKEPKTWISYARKTLPKTKPAGHSIRSLLLENTVLQFIILGIVLLIVLALALQAK